MCLPAKVDELVAAATERRKLFLANGMTAEVHEMRARAWRAFSGASMAAVVPFKKGRPVAKVAAG
jgi:hypothetical protein